MKVTPSEASIAYGYGSPNYHSGIDPERHYVEWLEARSIKLEASRVAAMNTHEELCDTRKMVCPEHPGFLSSIDTTGRSAVSLSCGRTVTAERVGVITETEREGE